MIRAAAFCPHPPVLVPQLAQGAAAELDDLRAACGTAIRRLAGTAGPLIVVGAGPRPARFGPDARGALGGFGTGEPPGDLPLSLTIGTWLAAQAGRPVDGSIAISADAATPDVPDGAVLLVMGDASARRSTAAPGYLDERAAGYDATVAQALAGGDPAGLTALDTSLGAELRAAGAPVWSAVAPLFGRTYAADLLYDDAPYGVGYVVAVWT